MTFASLEFFHNRSDFLQQTVGGKLRFSPLERWQVTLAGGRSLDGELLVAALAEWREGHVFGRRTLPEMDLASIACAIQNLWLVARAEGLGEELVFVNAWSNTEVGP
jgi:nitroreductase